MPADSIARLRAGATPDKHTRFHAHGIGRSRSKILQRRRVLSFLLSHLPPGRQAVRWLSLPGDNWPAEREIIRRLPNRELFLLGIERDQEVFYRGLGRLRRMGRHIRGSSWLGGVWKSHGREIQFFRRVIRRCQIYSVCCRLQDFMTLDLAPVADDTGHIWSATERDVWRENFKQANVAWLDLSSPSTSVELATACHNILNVSNRDCRQIPVAVTFSCQRDRHEQLAHLMESATADQMFDIRAEQVAGELNSNLDWIFEFAWSFRSDKQIGTVAGILRRA